MAESRFQRWSRHKAEARQQAQSSRPSAIAPNPTAEEQELVLNEALPEQELLEKYQLPAPDAITLGTDVTGFMRKEIPEYLRRKALRALWTSNPVLAVLDGLNDYDEDFSTVPASASGLRTLYKVGQGYFDKTTRLAEHDEELSKTATIEARPDNLHKEAVLKETAPPQTEPIVESPANPRPDEPAVSEISPAPRYRPRMGFE